MKNQKEFVIKKLLNEGEISRNTCIQNYITRLGAIINKLNQEGWLIEGEYRKTEFGNDYVYYLRKSPFRQVTYTAKLPEGDKVITTFERV